MKSMLSKGLVVRFTALTLAIRLNNFSVLHHPDAVLITKVTGVELQHHVDEEHQVDSLVEPPERVGSVGEALRLQEGDLDGRHDGAPEEQDHAPEVP